MSQKVENRKPTEEEKRGHLVNAQDESKTQQLSTDVGGAVAEYDAETLAALTATDDYEGMGKADIAVPFLVVLQGLSPQCVQGNPNYNEHARPGMISHSISKELFREAILTPVTYERSFLEWVPRKQGGGFRGDHKATELVPQGTGVAPMMYEEYFNAIRDKETGKGKLPNGNDLIETYTFYCLLHNENGSVESVVVAMASTMSSTAKKWNRMMINYSPVGVTRPAKGFKRYMAQYLFRTQIRQKDQNTWFVWDVTGARANSMEVLKAANEFEMQIRGNNVIIDRSQMQEAAQESGGSEAM